MILAPIFYPGSDPIVISVSPTVFSENVGATNGTTGGSATITISGGIGPYTATWVSDNPNITATNDVSVSTTTFDWLNLGGVADTEFAVITITVYDSILNSSTFNYSATVTRTH